MNPLQMNLYAAAIDSLRSRALAALACLLLATPVAATVVQPPPPGGHAPDPGWDALAGQLAALDAEHGGSLGVYLLDLASGQGTGWQADQPWYLASGIKVPVAIAVLRAVERGELALDTEVVLEPGDFVDGAGPTVHRKAGERLRVDWLLEQMLVHSDNTASDVLIRVAGLDVVNAIAAELMGQPVRITTLADVRRHAYSALHPAAAQLGPQDLLALKRAPFGGARLAVLAERLGIARTELRMDRIVPAFEAYYASGLNAAPLAAYARMLAALAEGRALGPRLTEWLLATMARAETGQRRIVAGLPGHVRFAHKTGTQLRRQCDFGIASADGGARLVIAACVADAPSRAAGEAALRAVGELVGSGALLSGATAGTVHASAAGATGTQRATP